MKKNKIAIKFKRGELLTILLVDYSGLILNIFNEGTMHILNVYQSRRVILPITSIILVSDFHASMILQNQFVF